MKLTELEPKLTEHQLSFRCPACGKHRIVIPVDRVGTGSAIPPVWLARGELDSLTVVPSIDSQTRPACRWHGWIRAGEVTPA